MDSLQKVRELMSIAQRMKYSKKRGSLYFQAFELALNAGDQELAMMCRLKECESYMFTDVFDDLLLAYAWCAAEMQQRPHLYKNQTYKFLFQSKGIPEDLACNPDIPRKTIEKQLSELKNLLRTHGYSESAYLSQAAKVAMNMGEYKKAEEYAKKALDTGRDGLSDCHACNLSTYGFTLFEQKKYARFLQVTKPLRNQEYSCVTSQLYTWAQTAWYEATMGNKKEALELARKAVKEAKKISDEDELHPILLAYHIAVMTKAEQWAQAITVFEECYDRVVDGLLFLQAGSYLFSQVDEKTVTLHIEKPKWARKDNTYNTNTLKEHLREEAKKLARRFDDRNGNTYFSDHIMDPF